MLNHQWVIWIAYEWSCVKIRYFDDVESFFLFWLTFIRAYVFFGRSAVQKECSKINGWPTATWHRYEESTSYRSFLLETTGFSISMVGVFMKYHSLPIFSRHQDLVSISFPPFSCMFYIFRWWFMNGSSISLSTDLWHTYLDIYIMYLHIYKKQTQFSSTFNILAALTSTKAPLTTRSQRSALRSLPTVDRARRPGGSSALRCVAGGSFS